MRLVRRAHLYAGLFMLPWVFLYGITALLFNHPGAFPDQAARRFGPSEWAGTSLANLPEPSKLASEVVEALNRPVGDGEPPDYRLIRPDEAGVAREVSATVRSGGRQYTVRIDVGSGEGSAREVLERRRPEPGPFATREAKTPSPPPLSDLEGELPDVLARAGLPTSEVIVRGRPELDFMMEGGGRTWRVQYDLTTGAVSGRPEDEPAGPLSPRRFLTRLHQAHGYPSSLGVRWVWAVAVDLMFVSMVGWGITGVLMWWQMKNVRRVGAVVLVLSALVAATLAVGMHEAISSATPPGRAESPSIEKSSREKRAQSAPSLPNAPDRPRS